VNALGGFSGAVLLALFAIVMAWESTERFFFPREIVFDQALLVAGVGLVVNLVSAFVLGVRHHDHGDDEEHPHHHDEDHNLRAAYLHVIADALTSVAAILALLAAKYLGAGWMDPLMGVLGSLLVARWSIGLIRSSSCVLLDHQAPEALREQVRAALEAEPGDVVTDLHLWSIGPGIWTAAITLRSPRPAAPGDYKRRIPTALGLVHATVEVHAGVEFGASTRSAN
jgi:cation diffusion facilitator family transporter